MIAKGILDTLVWGVKGCLYKNTYLSRKLRAFLARLTASEKEKSFLRTDGRRSSDDTIYQSY